jgi:hypothetical protein
VDASSYVILLNRSVLMVLCITAGCDRGMENECRCILIRSDTYQIHEFWLEVDEQLYWPFSMQLVDPMWFMIVYFRGLGLRLAGFAFLAGLRE